MGLNRLLQLGNRTLEDANPGEPCGTSSPLFHTTWRLLSYSIPQLSLPNVDADTGEVHRRLCKKDTLSGAHTTYE